MIEVLNCLESSENWDEFATSFSAIEKQLWCISLSHVHALVSLSILTQYLASNCCSINCMATLKDLENLLSPWYTIWCENICATLRHENIKQMGTNNPYKSFTLSFRLKVNTDELTLSQHRWALNSSLREHVYSRNRSHRARQSSGALCTSPGTHSNQNHVSDRQCK